MKLSKGLTNSQNSANLESIDSALEYLKAPDEVKKKVSKSEDSMTAKQISDLTKQVKEANKSADAFKEETKIFKERTEGWRKQYLEQRNSARDLAEQIEKVKQSKIQYIKDEDQAVTQELEELKAQLDSINTEKKQLIEERREAKRKFDETVDANVKHRLESHKEEIDRLTCQETSLNSRIEILKNNDVELEDMLLGKKQRLESVREALDAVATLAANSYEYLIEPELLEDKDLLLHWHDVINKLKPLTENIEFSLERHRKEKLKTVS